MRIAVINPNTTASMTRRIVAAAMAVASPGTEIVGMQSTAGLKRSKGHLTVNSPYRACSSRWSRRKWTTSTPISLRASRHHC